MHVLDMNTIRVLCIWGFSSKEISLAQITLSYKNKGLYDGKWPDLMTPKPDTVSTLGYHCTDCYHPMVFQWQSSVNLHNWNTLEDHWRHEYTRMLLQPNRLMLAPSCVLVSIQCWFAWLEYIGRQLDDRWKHTGNTLVTNIFLSSGIPVYIRV